MKIEKLNKKGFILAPQKLTFKPKIEKSPKNNDISHITPLLIKDKSLDNFNDATPEKIFQAIDYLYDFEIEESEDVIKAIKIFFKEKKNFFKAIFNHLL